jgi:hypothetical protein
MICIIGISTTFILNESKPTTSVNEIRAEHLKVLEMIVYSQTAGSSSRGRNITPDKTTIAINYVRYMSVDTRVWRLKSER